MVPILELAARFLSACERILAGQAAVATGSLFACVMTWGVAAAIQQLSSPILLSSEQTQTGVVFGFVPLDLTLPSD